MARDEVVANGGATVGGIVDTRAPGGRAITWCHVTDPEGNVIELQSASG